MTKWTFGIQAIATQPIPTVPRINTCILAMAVLAFISLFRQRRKQIKMMLATKARVQNIKAVYTKHYIATYSKILDLYSNKKTRHDSKILDLYGTKKTQHDSKILDLHCTKKTRQ